MTYYQSVCMLLFITLILKILKRKQKLRNVQLSHRGEPTQALVNNILHNSTPSFVPNKSKVSFVTEIPACYNTTVGMFFF